jgi:glycine C-acetyltransferase
VVIGDAAACGRPAEPLLDRGVYVIGFSYPVVPQGQARIRVQLSAAHSTEDVHRAVDAFVSARAELRAAGPSGEPAARTDPAAELQAARPIRGRQGW